MQRVTTPSVRPAASLRSLSAAGRPGRRNPAKRDLHRHIARRGLATIGRRDARRFGRGPLRLDSIEFGHAAAMPRPAVSENLKFFAHSFGAAFLFVSVFIA